MTDLNVDAAKQVIETIRARKDGLADASAQMAYRYEYGRILEFIGKNMDA